MDYIVRATAADGQIRAFAATTRETVETARQDHNTSPVATAALGRLLTAGAMMGVMMKGDKDLLTLRIHESDADSTCHVKFSFFVGRNHDVRVSDVTFYISFGICCYGNAVQRSAGMEFVAAYDALTKDAPRPESERIYVVAREKGKSEK